MARAPKAEKFSGNGANRSAKVSPSNSTATKTIWLWLGRWDGRMSSLKRVDMTSNLRVVFEVIPGPWHSAIAYGKTKSLQALTL